MSERHRMHPVTPRAAVRPPQVAASRYVTIDLFATITGLHARRDPQENRTRRLRRGQTVPARTRRPAVDGHQGTRAMGRSGDGVEIRPKSIRLFFVDPDGVRRRETLTLNGVPMKPTAANVAYARRQADKLRRAIELGTFQLADFFPDSPRAKEATPDPRPTTFGPLADLWLDAQGELAHATRAQYRGAIAFWKQLLGADTPLDQLTHQVLAAKLAATPGPPPSCSTTT